MGNVQELLLCLKKKSQGTQSMYSKIPTFSQVFIEGKKKKKTSETVNLMLGTSLTVQWLRLYTSNAGGVGLIPNQRTKLSHASGVGWQKKNVNGGYVRRWDNEQMISLL